MRLVQKDPLMEPKRHLEIEEYLRNFDNLDAQEQRQHFSFAMHWLIWRLTSGPQIDEPTRRRILQQGLQQNE